MFDEQLDNVEYHITQVEHTRKTYLTKVTEDKQYTRATAPLMVDPPPAHEPVSATPAMDLVRVLETPRSRMKSKDTSVDESKDDSGDEVVNEEMVKGRSKGSVSRCTSKASASDESSASQIQGFGEASKFNVGQADPLEGISMQAITLAKQQRELKAAEPPPLAQQHPLLQQEPSSSSRIEGIKGLLSEAEVLEKIAAIAEMAEILEETGSNAKRQPEEELPEAKGKGKKARLESAYQWEAQLKKDYVVEEAPPAPTETLREMTDVYDMADDSYPGRCTDAPLEGKTVKQL